MFALINRDLTDTGKRYDQIVELIPASDLHPAKPYWVPVVEEVTDTSTGPEKVVSPWVETVEVARLLRARTIRDKTAGELDDEDQERVDALLLNSGVTRALAQMLFEVAKAGKTGDWAFFDSATNASTFKTLIKGLIR